MLRTYVRKYGSTVLNENTREYHPNTLSVIILLDAFSESFANNETIKRHRTGKIDGDRYLNGMLESFKRLYGIHELYIMFG